jgi:hypothetical protein
VKFAENTYCNQINRVPSVGSDDGVVDCVYLSCYPQNVYENIYKLRDKTTKNISNAILKSVEFREFKKAGGDLSDCQGYFSCAPKLVVGHTKTEL